LARTARPSDKPKSSRAPQGVGGRKGVSSFPGRRSKTTAAETRDIVSMAAKGMSVAAAREKPIMATLDGKRSSTQSAHSFP